MLVFEEVSHGYISRLGLTAGPGMVVSIMATSAYEVELMINLLLGLKKPDSGRITIFGKEAGTLTPGEEAAFGVVFRDGGLISNLSVYENIVLPTWYHMGVDPMSIREEAASILEGMGVPRRRFDDYGTLRPSDIPAFERRLAGICRSLLLKPELTVYESVLDGLRIEVKDMVADTIAAYHRESVGRTSVFVGTDSGPGEYLRPDLGIRL